MQATTARDKYIKVRELRAHLAEVLKLGDGRIVGDRWTARALVLPIPAYTSWDAKSKKKALAQLKRNFTALLGELR